MRERLRCLWLIAYVLVACASPDDSVSYSTDDSRSQRQRPPRAGFAPGMQPGRDREQMPDAGTQETRTPLAPGSCGSFSGVPGSRNPQAVGAFYEFNHGGLTRQYKIYVPSRYTNDELLPVLYILHGYPGKAELLAFEGTDLDSTAEQNGFILVAPSGHESSWNGGECCGAAVEQEIDDIGFLRELQRRLTSDLGLCIDPSRIYAAGYSNGAYLGYRLACEASDMFAAIAGVGGEMKIEPEACAASFARPVPMLEVHGTNDLVANVDEARASIETIANLSGCAEELAPAAVPEASLETSCQSYAKCPEGVEITLCLSEGKGHCWYGSKTCGSGRPISALLASSAKGIKANEAVWSFVSRFRCEECNGAETANSD